MNAHIERVRGRAEDLSAEKYSIQISIEGICRTISREKNIGNSIDCHVYTVKLRTDLYDSKAFRGPNLTRPDTFS